MTAAYCGLEEIHFNFLFTFLPLVFIFTFIFIVFPAFADLEAFTVILVTAFFMTLILTDALFLLPSAAVAVIVTVFPAVRFLIETTPSTTVATFGLEDVHTNFLFAASSGKIVTVSVTFLPCAIFRFASSNVIADTFFCCTTGVFFFHFAYKVISFITSVLKLNLVFNDASIYQPSNVYPFRFVTAKAAETFPFGLIFCDFTVVPPLLLNVIVKFKTEGFVSSFLVHFAYKIISAITSDSKSYNSVNASS